MLTAVMANGSATNVPATLRHQGRKVRWFCNAMGISVSYYKMIERGERRTPDDYLSKAAALLGVPVESLRCGEVVPMA